MVPEVVTAKYRGGAERYSGWLVSVGVDVARLRLDSPSRVAFPPPPPPPLLIWQPSLSFPDHNPFHFSVYIPSPSISLLLPVSLSFIPVLVLFFPRSYGVSLGPIPSSHPSTAAVSLSLSFSYTRYHSYYRSRTFSRRCPPSRGHKIQSGILISPPLCRAVPVPTDYFNPA